MISFKLWLEGAGAGGRGSGGGPRKLSFVVVGRQGEEGGLLGGYGGDGGNYCGAGNAP